jgi:hypothetical protein
VLAGVADAGVRGAEIIIIPGTAAAAVGIGGATFVELGVDAGVFNQVAGICSATVVIIAPFVLGTATFDAGVLALFDCQVTGICRTDIVVAAVGVLRIAVYGNGVCALAAG